MNILEEILTKFERLCNDVTFIREYVVINNKQEFLQNDRWFTIKELCHYLPNKPSKATIYSYTRANKIPYHKADGEKTLRFLKSEIDAWLKRGKKKTASDIEAEADEFLSSRKRKEVRHA